jgi:hypothetical protein
MSDEKPEEQPTRPEPPPGSLIMKIRITPIDDEEKDEPEEQPITEKR